MSFRGKAAIIVGGTGGIGSQAARHLLLQGVEKLAVFDIVYSHEGIEHLQNEFPKRTIIFRKTDVTSRIEVERSFREICVKFGRLDIVVNSVGIIDENDIEGTIAVNLVGVINCTQVAIEHMSIEKGGRGGIIANVSSVCGLDGLFSDPISAATKHAVVGFTRSLGDSFYYNIYGIKFIVICPGITETPIIDQLEDRLYRHDAAEPTIKVFNRQGSQTADVCGKLLVDILPKAKNGSVWMVNLGEAQEIFLKKQWLKE